MSGNSWLARQRKSDLVEMAQAVGLKEYVRSPALQKWLLGEINMVISC
jgi:hypothetical protein